MASLDYQSLATSVSAYNGAAGLSGFQILKLALLKNIAATVAPAMATDYQSLISSTNEAGYNASAAVSIGDLLELALLQIIANNAGGGGGGGAQLVTYTSGSPASPSNPNQAAIAYDPTGILPTLGWNTSNNTWN